MSLSPNLFSKGSLYENIFSMSQHCYALFFATKSDPEYCWTCVFLLKSKSEASTCFFFKYCFFRKGFKYLSHFPSSDKHYA